MQSFYQDSTGNTWDWYGSFPDGPTSSLIPQPIKNLLGRTEESWEVMMSIHLHRPLGVAKLN